mmetsp:Transcript_33177/g.84228  ORF Transcript_33177/g.84228 Transcript_33177/m.84228 type:complete len:328 (-) Transcript_33177:1286-2269(-)
MMARACSCAAVGGGWGGPAAAAAEPGAAPAPPGAVGCWGGQPPGGSSGLMRIMGKNTPISALIDALNLDSSDRKMEQHSCSAAGTLEDVFLSRLTHRYCLMAPMNFSERLNVGPLFSSSTLSSSSASTLPRTAVGSCTVAVSLVRMDSLHSARNTRNASFCSTAVRAVSLGLLRGPPNGPPMTSTVMAAEVAVAVEPAGPPGAPLAEEVEGGPASSSSDSAPCSGWCRAPNAPATVARTSSGVCAGAATMTTLFRNDCTLANTKDAPASRAEDAPLAPLRPISTSVTAIGRTSTMTSSASMRWNTTLTIWVSDARAVVWLTSLRLMR